MTQAAPPTMRPAFWLADDVVDAFVSGTLSREEEADLACRVAPLVADHHLLPNHTVATLGRVQHHLGGSSGVLAWLDGFPGEPRTMARVMAVGDLLDRFSDDETVIAALRDVRHTTSDSADLVGHIVFATDEATLANLAHDMEKLAADGRTSEAVRLALAAVELLGRVQPRLGSASAAAQVITPAALAALRTGLEEVQA